MSSTSLDSLFTKLLDLRDSLATSAEQKDVHKLRTTCRRIETVLRIRDDRPGRAASKVLRSTKRLRKAAGDVRDLDVQLTILENLNGDSVAQEKRSVASQLQKTRGKRAAKLIADVEEELDKNFEDRIAKVSGRLPGSTSDNNGFASRALEAFASVAQDYPTLTKANLHQFRIACKHVRYTAEMDETQLAQTVVTEAKRMTDAIGDWHDVLTLAERAEKVLRRRKGSPLMQMLRQLQARKLDDALDITADVKSKLLHLHAENAMRLAEESGATAASVEAA